ncbi:MAG: hypothetical protein HYY23_16525 [Verrucomicrobia bacterium]|nr:hypothetical protein [Verrucomicrobiota bacterium]
MKRLKQIAFVLEDFALQTPGQQLLDRFLMGYPRDGAFHRLENCRVSAHIADQAANAEIERREKSFGLRVRRDLRQAVAGADGVIVAWRGSGVEAKDELLKEILPSVPRGTPCFVHGALSASLAGAQEIKRLAFSRRVVVLAGTPLGVTWRLPEVEIPQGTALKEALVVVQGKSPTAEFESLEALLPVIERRQGGESGVRNVRFFQGTNVWKSGEDGQWSWPLLASALARSDSPQGDAVKDGRTQDLAGLGLVQKLAREPRGWALEHRDGLRSTILVLDGVVADYNFAVRTGDGQILSAQVYRPPAPAEHHFTRLATGIEDFFRTGKQPWALERSALIAGLLEVLRNPSAPHGQAIETPELRISYGG